jgi:sec-independent protein translocase protein TatC
MADSKRPEDSHVEMPFLSHLVELRDRILRSLLAVAIIFILLFSYANDLYTFLADPLMRLLPKGSTMIAIEVTSPLIAPLKLTLVLSFYLAIPYILYHLWGFVAPGLYQHEKKLVMPLLISSSLLFYLGMAFAYYIVFPLVFGFFVSVAPTGIAVSTDISHYLDVLCVWRCF